MFAGADSFAIGWGTGGWGGGGEKAPVQREKCSLHGKERNMDCLETDGAGGYTCKPTHMCKTGAGGGGMPAQGEDTIKEKCSAHGKDRSMVCLEPDGAGGYKCKASHMCKVAGGTPGPGGKADGKGAWGAGWGGGWEDWMAEMWNMMMAKGKGKGFGKGESDGKGFVSEGKGKGKGDGKAPADQSRESIMQGQYFGGTVTDWKGKYGWILPSETIDHPKASLRGGKIFVHMKDIASGPAELAAGQEVQFSLYEDATGLGAESVLASM